jgi:AAA domain
MPSADWWCRRVRQNLDRRCGTFPIGTVPAPIPFGLFCRLTCADGPVKVAIPASRCFGARQSYVINSAIAGGDLVCIGPPGTGKSQTIANLIDTLSARGKKTLFVAEKRAAIDAVLKRLFKVGLGDLVMDLHDGSGSRRVLAQQLAKALAGASSVPLSEMAGEQQRLVRRRAGDSGPGARPSCATKASQMSHG